MIFIAVRLYVSGHGLYAVLREPRIPLPSGTGIVKPEVNIYCQGNGKGSNAGHLGGFKDAENQVGVVSSEIFQKEAGCAV